MFKRLKVKKKSEKLKFVKNLSKKSSKNLSKKSSKNFLEHEKTGTPVMQVSAVDNDGTYPNNRVRYKISDRNAQGIKDKFEINADTGMIHKYTDSNFS
jgi:hypothetical protein